MPAELSTPLWPLSFGASASTSPGALSFALNTAYAFGGGSDRSVGLRFVSPVTGTLDKVYVFTNASAGTPGNLTLELRAMSTATVPTSGTPIATQSAAWVGANKWMQCVFGSPGSVVKNSAYFITIGNADASPTVNYPTVLQGYGGPSPGGTFLERFKSVSTTNGWTTGSVDFRSPVIVLVFSDGTVWGSPYTTSVNNAGALRRGIKIDPLTYSIGLTGAGISPLTSCTTLEFYEGATVPGGTLMRTADTLSADNRTLSQIAIPEIVLPPSIAHRIVLTVSVASAAPGCWQIQDYAAFSDVPLAGLAQGKIYSTKDDGAGGWTDEPDKLPRMDIVVSRYGESSGGSSDIYAEIRGRQIEKARGGYA